MNLTIGKATILRLPEPIARVSVGNPLIADVTTLTSNELYLLGKDVGTTNLIVWAKNGHPTVIDVTVAADPRLLEQHLAKLLPMEKDIHATVSSESIVLYGSVSDSLRAAQAVELAQVWVRSLSRGLTLPVSLGVSRQPEGEKAGTPQAVAAADRNIAQTRREPGPPVVNMLTVRAPMQVMLEVKVAEISKTLLSRLGVTVAKHASSGSTRFDLLSRSNFFGQLLGAAALSRPSGDFAQIDAQRDDGLIKLLAEPNIMAISGQEASFRAGGKIFIPVARRNDQTGGTTITLEEKEFGVGLKFKPTVLADNRINLRVAPEVSELQQTGTPFTTVDGTTSVLPSMTLRRAETTLQLNDGDTFMIAGLVQNNANATINRFPGLGDVPILGALFRSSEFKADKTELMFVITAHLVKPLEGAVDLPTDGYTAPSLREFHLNGEMPDTGRAGGFATH
jgi:pilus assembly protein CpaC